MNEPSSLSIERIALQLGKYEAEIEAWALFNLAIRHIDGVIALARHDLILLPPALMAARAGFEAAIKAAWLVDADVSLRVVIKFSNRSSRRPHTLATDFVTGT
jgi:hypothetical protein